MPPSVSILDEIVALVYVVCVMYSINGLTFAGIGAGARSVGEMGEEWNGGEMTQGFHRTGC